MTCSSIDIIGEEDIRIPIKTGFAAVLNLTHESLETLQLEKTDWREALIEPHTSTFGLELTPWYKDAIMLMGGGLAVLSTFTIIGVMITFCVHYQKKLKAAAATLASLP